MNSANSKNNKNFLSMFQYLFLLISILFVLPYCSSKKSIKVEKLEYNFGGSFSIDTIKLKANKEDVAWKITADNFWVLLDSQLQFGSKEFMFNILDNPDTVQREAMIFVTGQDLDTIFLKIKQDKGFASLAKPENTPKQEVAGNNNKKSSKKIIIEEQLVEDISDASGKNVASSNADKKENTSSKSKDNEVTKTKMEISVDEAILGAANNLEGNAITLDATEAWQVNFKTVPQWLSVISAADGKAITQGKGGINFKFKTREANTTSAAKEAVVEFLSGKIIKTIKVTQKPTEAELVIDPSNLKIPGEPDEKAIEVNVKATNTQWEIKSEIPSWIKINKTKGTAGQSIITVKATLNETQNPRDAKLTFVSTGDAIKKDLVISQDIQSVKIQVSTLLDALGSKAESFSTFTVNSTAEWQIVKNEEITWYDVDVTSGTGGEDNVETVTVTAVENNPDIERIDTLFIVSKSVKRKVIIVQRGTKLKPIVLNVIGTDTIDFDSDINESRGPGIAINSNDKWTIKNLPNWLTAVSQSTKTSITNGYGDDKIELKLAQPKDSIKASKLQFFTIQSDLDPNMKKNIYIKSKSAVVKKEINVTGLTAGNYIPYLEIGNISKSVSKPNAVASTVTFNVYSSIEFILKEDVNKESTVENFFVLKVDKENYVLGDIIPSGNHEVTVSAQGDNILEPVKSKIKILYFMVDGEMMPYKDNTNDKSEILQLEIKQEPFVLDESKPKILVENISFNGYNSYVLLGNPNVKKESSDTGTIELPKKTIKIKTNRSIKLTMVEDMTPFFNIYYGTSPDKTNNAYKIGKTINPGEYFFSFESKKNYTDPNGFKSRQTLTLFFEMATEGKKEKVVADENAADAQPNLIFIDMKNRDYSGLHFRTEFLVEQESL